MSCSTPLVTKITVLFFQNVRSVEETRPMQFSVIQHIDDHNDGYHYSIRGKKAPQAFLRNLQRLQEASGRAQQRVPPALRGCCKQTCQARLADPGSGLWQRSIVLYAQPVRPLGCGIGYFVVLSCRSRSPAERNA